MSTNILGKKVKKARLEAYLSQKDLGKALHVSEKTISAYELGRTKPPMNTLQKIAQKTNKPLWYFSTENNTELTIMTKLTAIEFQLEEIKNLLNKKP